MYVWSACLGLVVAVCYIRRRGREINISSFSASFTLDSESLIAICYTLDSVLALSLSRDLQFIAHTHTHAHMAHGCLIQRMPPLLCNSLHSVVGIYSFHWLHILASRSLCSPLCSALTLLTINVLSMGNSVFFQSRD